MTSTAVRRVRRLSPLAGLGVALLAASVAFAHAPTVTMDPIGNLSYASFPQTYNVTGQVCHSNPANVSAVSEVTLYIDNVQHGTAFNPNAGNAACANFSLPWTISAPGTYTVKVTARHGNDLGWDDEVVVVSGTITVTHCPAAPAIASDYLRNTVGWKPVTGKFKYIMNLVAGQTGVNGSLWAANACEAWYPGAVIAFVNANI